MRCDSARWRCERGGGYAQRTEEHRGRENEAIMGTPSRSIIT